ncbi:MAG: hypothetical protein MHPSP_003380, partial [Paramarteilia canceri]
MSVMLYTILFLKNEKISFGDMKSSLSDIIPNALANDENYVIKGKIKLQTFPGIINTSDIETLDWNSKLVEYFTNQLLNNCKKKAQTTMVDDEMIYYLV